MGDWNAKVGSQETPGVTGTFGLGVWNEAGQRLIEICQENALVITNTLFPNTKKDALFIIGDWNAKAGSQETPGVTGRVGLEVQNEAGQRLIAGVQPRWIQGILSEDGVGEGKIYLFINIRLD